MNCGTNQSCGSVFQKKFSQLVEFRSKDNMLIKTTEHKSILQRILTSCSLWLNQIHMYMNKMGVGWGVASPSIRGANFWKAHHGVAPGDKLRMLSAEPGQQHSAKLSINIKLPLTLTRNLCHPSYPWRSLYCFPHVGLWLERECPRKHGRKGCPSVQRSHSRAPEEGSQLG